MAKKKTNQFNAESEGVKAGAPGDETPAVIADGKPKPVKFKKNGEPFKVRGPSGPRSVNPAVTAFKAEAVKALAKFMAEQKAGLDALVKSIRVESESAKLQTRMEKKTLAMSPAELEWLKNQAANILDAKAAAKKPEPEQQEGAVTS